MNVADVLERAADLIDKRGKFTIGMPRSSGRPGEAATGELCAVAAIQHAVAYDVWDIADACDVLRLTVSPLLIGEWSDTSDHATVTSTLRACAAVERARAAVAETVAA